MTSNTTLMTGNTFFNDNVQICIKMNIVIILNTWTDSFNNYKGEGEGESAIKNQFSYSCCGYSKEPSQSS